MTGPRVLELFAGCGGAALGLHRAGFAHVACVEKDDAAASTLACAGFPVLRADVATIDYAPFKGAVDLLWASPPCQPGSTAGLRLGASDPRDGWPATIRAIDRVEPTWFLAENVRGWTFHSSHCSGDGRCPGCAWRDHVLPSIARRFPFHGVWLVDAADFGVPQHRRRVVLWAGPRPLVTPLQSHAHPDRAAAQGLRPWVTMRAAVGHTLFNVDTCNERACYPCNGDYGRACTEPWRADRPSPTVMTTEVKGTRAYGPAWAFEGSPNRASDTAFLVAGIRRISVEEGLALQSFPSGWPLQGTLEERYRQVGNAVPPPMATALGRCVTQAFSSGGQFMSAF